MSTPKAPPSVDWEQLEKPVSKKHPEGESLRYEGTYDQIQDSRRRDDPRLAQGVWETKIKQADWAKASQVALDSLTTRTKDVQVATWLLESWMHQYGYGGVRQGLEILLRLCKTFWKDLHPQIEDGNLDARVSPFEWINEKLTIQLKLIPLTAPKMNDHEVYSYADWETATRNENEARKSEEAKERLQDQLNQAAFHSSCQATPLEFYTVVNSDIKTSLETLLELEAFLDEKCKKESPSLIAFRQTLEAIERLGDDIFEKLGGNQVPEEPEEEPIDEEEEDEPFDDSEEDEKEEPIEDMAPDSEEQEPQEEPKETTPSAKGGIRNRAEAYRMLEKAANYLRKTEPHSPTPYLVKRAVAWGNMTLEDLLIEIVRDDNDLRFIYELLGMKPNSEGELDTGVVDDDEDDDDDSY